MFKSYGDFESHEHRFNTLFSTSVAIFISLLVGGALAANNFFYSSSAWSVTVVLIVAPGIVFAATAGETEFKTAYYKAWRDRIAGGADQRKILRQFAKQYGVKNWRTKLENIKADGRWNFHVDTNYMHTLARQRDLLLNQIYGEYLDRQAANDKAILEARRVVKDLEIELETAKKVEGEAQNLLDNAKSSGEVYKQRQDYYVRIERTKQVEQRLNDAKCDLLTAEQKQNNLSDGYYEVAHRVKKIYYARYVKYTEPAVKKINRINGLKYVISDMPQPEAWANNPIRKEVK